MDNHWYVWNLYDVMHAGYGYVIFLLHTHTHTHTQDMLKPRKTLAPAPPKSTDKKQLPQGLMEQLKDKMAGSVPFGKEETSDAGSVGHSSNSKDTLSSRKGEEEIDHPTQGLQGKSSPGKEQRVTPSATSSTRRNEEDQPATRRESTGRKTAPPPPASRSPHQRKGTVARHAPPPPKPGQG